MINISNKDELEEIFDKLDRVLHKETYLNLQDKVFSLGDDLEKANETIEFYRDKEESRVG